MFLLFLLCSVLSIIHTASATFQQVLPEECSTCLHAFKRLTYDDAFLQGTNDDCLVYVVGNHGNFSFERSVQEQYVGCEVHTFDSVAAQHPSGIHFHVMNHTKERMGHSVAAFVEYLGHTNRTIRMLKVGCSACTWDSYTSSFLFNLLGAGMDIKQISIELPWHSGKLEERALFKFMEAHGYSIPRLERVAPICDAGCVGHVSLMTSDLQQMGHRNEFQKQRASRATLTARLRSTEVGTQPDELDTSVLHSAIESTAPEAFSEELPGSELRPSVAPLQNVTKLPALATSQATLEAAATPKSLLERWYSPDCMQWFVLDKVEPVRGGAWDTVAQRITREDLCKGGRRDSVDPAHSANEIVVVHELRMVYVEVRKSASSTIRSALHKYYRAGYDTCGGTTVSDQCKGVHARCTSECLSGKQLQDYFFFSFVRDPTERFYSSLKEAMVGQGMNTLTKSIAMNLLHSTLDRDCHFDQHLESQAAALSTRLAPKAGNSSFELELDFIGRVEHLQEDMAEALRQGEAKAGVPFDAGRRQQLINHMAGRANTGSALKDVALSVRDEELDDLAREVYAQDVACFGQGQ